MIRYARPTSDQPTVDHDVVIPTIGRPGLGRLLESLGRGMAAPDPGVLPRSIIVVDDRPDADGALDVPALDVPVHVVASGGRGPAAARNRGWARSTSTWVAFLDDDVIVHPGWNRALTDDLAAADDRVGAVKGRVHVPMPYGRRPTDRERNVAGLEDARWITADMAIRRAALAEVGGFDERFPRAYREDSDIALRILDAGWSIEDGRRAVDHPVGDAPWTVSISTQRGNADDALMARLHGADWRERAGAHRGALRRHVAATATAATALAAALAGRRRSATALAGGWFLQWARFAGRRLAAGPRTAGEVAAMAATSAALPPAATYWSVLGRIRARQIAPAGAADRWETRRPTAVLFDRDGTLVHDVPYNGDPDRVEAVPGAREALDWLRAEGIAVGLVSNQSGVARGLITEDQVRAVNQRVVDVLGPFDTVQWCPHGADDRCSCRKPSTGMLEAAAAAVGQPPLRCAMVGDIGSDIEAGVSCGMRSILVPTAITEADEVHGAPEVACSLAEAVEALLGSHRLAAGHQLRLHARSLEHVEEWVS